MAKSTSKLLPYSFKNGKERIETNQPKLDDNGNPIIKNGRVVMNWDNARDKDNKPIYTPKVVYVTYIPEDGKSIPSVLSKTMMSKLIKDAATREQTFLTVDGAYTSDREFAPQTDVNDDGDEITTITVKYVPYYRTSKATVSNW